MLNAGARFAVGSDLPSAKVQGVIATVREMEIMVELGAHPMMVIKGATALPAEPCGLEDVVGTLKEDRVADLLVVEGCPCQDMKVLENPTAIMKDGQWIKNVIS